jgi:hypothetical protein
MKNRIDTFNDLRDYLNFVVEQIPGFVMRENSVVMGGMGLSKMEAYDMWIDMCERFKGEKVDEGLVGDVMHEFSVKWLGDSFKIDEVVEKKKVEGFDEFLSSVIEKEFGFDLKKLNMMGIGRGRFLMFRCLVDIWVGGSEGV